MSDADDNELRRLAESAREQMEGVQFNMNNPMLVAAVAQSNRELFDEYINQNFTPQQALYLTAACMNENPLTPPVVN